MMTSGLRALAFATLTMLACSTSWALGSGGTLADLLQTHWTARDGAPTVTSLIAQTPDGYVWMGDSTGLSRFDALRFEHVELNGADEFSSAPVHSLFAPRGGGLWIGYSFGGVAFLRDGHVQAYGEREGLPRGASVTDIAEQPDGTLWIATRSGLGWLRDGTWHRVGADWNLAAGATIGLTVDSTGALWTEAGGTLYRLGPGQHRFEPISSVGNAHVYVVEAPTGEVWAADLSTLRQVYRNPASHRSWASATSPVLVDNEGALWGFVDTPNAGGDDGYALVRIARQDLPAPGAKLALARAKDRLAVIAGRPASDWGLLLLDHEGNVWLTGNSGPIRFSQRNVRHVGLPSDSDQWNTGALGADREGNIWISPGFEDHLYRLAPGGKPVRQDLRNVWCMAGTESGEMWFAASDALWRRRAGRLEKVLPLDTRVQAMVDDRDGAVWISLINKGLFRLADGHLVRNGGLPALDVGPALILARDQAGRVWAGYAGGRVAIVSGSDVRFFGRDDGLSVGNVVSLYGQRESVWVGGDAGLARFDGRRFRTLLTDQPGLLRSVTGIVETASGDVWLNTATGVVRLPASELKRTVGDPAYRMSAEVFGAQAGLEGTGARIAPLPSLIEGKDGRLWAVTTIGAYTIDPGHLSRSPLPPALSLQAFTADDRVEPLSGVVALPARASSLHFRYEGLSLTAAEQVRYRYRLDGVDRDWHAVQDQRDAYYMNLGPGTYRFRVQSKIAGMDWNEGEAALAFTIAPAFVQTRLFVAVCVLAVLLATWLVVRVRVSRMAQRIRIGLIARIGERERIARELHDTLLQGTQGLLLSVHALAARAHRGEQVGDALEQVIAGTDDILTESRDRIQDLRATTLSSAALVESLLALGEELERGSESKLQVVVRGAIRELEPTVADETFCIAREALRNAFKHARASLIKVEIAYGIDRFRLFVRDDGVGIDARALAAGARPGHWGLAGMHERASRISARFEVRRLAGTPGDIESGTEIDLSVAARVAYPASSAPAGWLARIRAALRGEHGGDESAERALAVLSPRGQDDELPLSTGSLTP